MRAAVSQLCAVLCLHPTRLPQPFSHIRAFQILRAIKIIKLGVQLLCASCGQLGMSEIVEILF